MELFKDSFPHNFFSSSSACGLYYGTVVYRRLGVVNQLHEQSKFTTDRWANS